MFNENDLKRVVCSLPQVEGFPSVELLDQGEQKAKQGDLRGAIAVYTQAIQANPQFTEAYIKRGIAHHDLENFDQAVLDFSQALRLDPKNAIALYNRFV